jgi:predicted ATPase
MEQTIASWNPEEEHRDVRLAGSDLGTGILIFLHRILVCLGHTNRARSVADRAIAKATKLNYPPTLDFAYLHDFRTHWMLRDKIRLLSTVESAIALQNKHGIPTLGVHHGWIEVTTGDFEQGIRRMHDGIAAFRRLRPGDEVIKISNLILIADAHLQARQRIEEGLSAAMEIIAVIAETGERWCEPEAYRLKGELLLAGSKPDPTAEACFVKAIGIAQEQSAKLWELRAATSLARLRHHQGRNAEARDTLAPIYGWFTEDPELPDLKDARALLEGGTG